MVHKDKWHQSLQSDVGLPMDTTNGPRLGLGWPDLGFTDEFDQGSSSKAHTFPNFFFFFDDFNTNLYPPSMKMRTS